MQPVGPPKVGLLAYTSPNYQSHSNSHQGFSVFPNPAESVPLDKQREADVWLPHLPACIKAHEQPQGTETEGRAKEQPPLLQPWGSLGSARFKPLTIT